MVPLLLVAAGRALWRDPDGVAAALGRLCAFLPGLGETAQLARRG